MINIISKIIQFNKIVVIGAFITDTETLYTVLTVRKQKNKLIISDSFTASQIEEVVADINIKLPVLLVIDGKGVLNKKTEPANEADIAWKKNLDYGNIYFNEFKNKDSVVISLCRRKLADEIIDILRANKLDILDFFIGPLTAALLKSSSKNNEVIIANQSSLQFDKEDLVSVFKDVNNVDYIFDADGTKLNRYQVPLYSSVVQYFVKSNRFNKSNVVLKTEELLYKKAFEKLAVGMLAIFFLLLLSSYCLIQYYSGKNAELNYETVFSNQSVKRIVELENKKEQKLIQLKQNGIFSKKFLSFYVYSTLKTVPTGISLNRFDVFPISGEIKENSKIALEPEIMYVEGITTGEDIFKSWMDNLHQMEGVKNIEIVFLKKDSKGIQKFKLKILLGNV